MARQAVSLVKHKSGKAFYWYLRYYDNAGKYKGESIGRTDKVSKRQAKKIQQQKIREFEQQPGRRGRDRNVKLSDFIEHYFDVRETELADKSLELHRNAAGYLMEYFGKGKHLERISKANARAFQAAMTKNKVHVKGWRKTKINKTTVNMYMRACRAMFTMAVEDDLLIKNPFSGIVNNPRTEKKWHYVSGEEYQKMIDIAPIHLKLLISLCRLAGLRKKEAESLEWSDIDFENNRLHITPKDHWKPKTESSIREIPLCKELQDVITEAYQKAEEGQERIIRGGSLENIDRDFKLLRRKAHVPQYSKPLHTLRKSCITDWAGRFPMHVAQRWAGHSKITTTAKYYSQVRDDDYERAAEMQLFEKVYTQNDTQNEKSTKTAKQRNDVKT